MKFICSKDNLLEGILTVQKAVPTRTTLPILQGILLDLRDNCLTLRGTDLDMGIECVVDAEIISNGWVVLDSRLLGEILRRFPPEDVELSVLEDNSTEIKCANSFIRLQGHRGDEFPQLPKINGERGLTIPQNLLKDAIRQIVFACATEETRPILTGALMECDSNNMVLTALDGFRLAVKTLTLKGEQGNMLSVVPAKTLNELQRILKETQEDVYITLAGNHILFALGDTKVTSRLLEGDFIDYRQIIPETYNTSVRFKREALLESCERASLMAREGKNNLIKLNITGDLLEITSNAEIGDVREEVSVETEGEELEIAFNSKYLIDVLRIMDEEYLRIEFTTNVSPCIIKAEDSEDYIYLLLPVRTMS